MSNVNFARGMAASILVAMTSLPTVAGAQQNPELGDSWTPPPAQQQPAQGWQQQPPPPQGGWQQQPPPPQGGWHQPPPPPPPPSRGGDGERPPALGGADSAAPGASDHSRWVGHLAVGMVGAAPFRLSDASFASSDSLIPTIGVRYWLSESLGLDVGLGFATTGGTTTRDAPDSVVDADIDSETAFALHGGLPLVLHHEGHYKFLLVPEMNISIGSGTQFQSPATSDDDVELSSFSFQVGARAGAEIHFGFMDIPQLSLQGSVGAFFTYVSSTASQLEGGQEVFYTINETAITTTVLNNPWDILTATVTALYYF